MTLSMEIFNGKLLQQTTDRQATSKPWRVPGLLLVILTAICVSSHSVAADTGNSFTVPLTSQGRWQVLQYSSIRANDVKFDKDGLLINVDNSASPLIYPLQPRQVKSVIFSIEINGSLNLGDEPQGSKRGDDFLFRLGLVYEGKHTLNFLERKFAADWIVTLHDLAPEGTGIDRIQFYDVYSDPRLAHKSRQHPLSEFVYETFLFPAPKNGKLSGKIRTHNKSPVLALWISSDGDDTESHYQVRIRKIILQ